MEPIEWVVLNQQDDRILVVSRYIIDYQPFHDVYAKQEANGVITWENSYIRDYLNSRFIESAFSKEERNSIVDVVVDNSSKQGVEPGGYLINSISTSESSTKDKIFLLSYAERLQYKENVDETKPTAYVAQQQDQVQRSRNWWWVRSNGRARFVDYGEYVDLLNTGVVVRGEQNTNLHWHAFSYLQVKRGIRPAMWISVDTVVLN